MASARHHDSQLARHLVQMCIRDRALSDYGIPLTADIDMFGDFD